eukprot:jgi/Psemu1/18347/gm1.18347_g
MGNNPMNYSEYSVSPEGSPFRTATLVHKEELQMGGMLGTLIVDRVLNLFEAQAVGGMGISVVDTSAVICMHIIHGIQKFPGAIGQASPNKGNPFGHLDDIVGDAGKLNTTLPPWLSTPIKKTLLLLQRMGLALQDAPGTQGLLHFYSLQVFFEVLYSHLDHHSLLEICEPVLDTLRVTGTYTAASNRTNMCMPDLLIYMKHNKKVLLRDLLGLGGGVAPRRDLALTAAVTTLTDHQLKLSEDLDRKRSKAAKANTMKDIWKNKKMHMIFQSQADTLAVELSSSNNHGCADVSFYLGSRVVILHTGPAPELHAATSITLTFAVQKNGDNGEVQPVHGKSFTSGATVLAAHPLALLCSWSVISLMWKLTKASTLGLDFGEEPHNIHLASPGERLHMHQLGCAKRAAETFCEEFLGNNMCLLGDMDQIASYYGDAVQRQSDRDFPRNHFSESIHTAKKEGNQYIGMLYIQTLALLSTEVDNQRRKCDRRIYAIELLLGMEKFLKYAGMFDQGEGNNLVMNHMYFHLSQYMRLFGPPTAAWDSAASESNHKSEPLMEYCTIDRLDREFDLFHHKLFTGVSHPTAGGWSAGSKFLICVMDGLPYMKWDEKKNASVPWFPSDILKFCDVILPADQHTLWIHRAQESDSGQLSNVWYDWESFQLDLLDRCGLQVYPCQILCLLHLEGPFPPGSSVSRFELVHDGYYTVAHCFLSVDPISSNKDKAKRYPTHW